MKVQMRVAAVIVNYRTPDLVLQCVGALAQERASIPDLKVLVVDNASADGSREQLSSGLTQPAFAEWVEFIPLDFNGGFGWGNNQAILHLLQEENPPDAIYLVNPDTLISAGSLVALVREMECKHDAGAIGSQLFDTNGLPTGSAFQFPSIAREFSRGLGIGTVERFLGIRPGLIPYGVRHPVDWVTGASVLIRTSALKAAGMFDTGFFLYFEEVELMHRLKRHGWKTYHCPESKVTHIAGASTGIIDGRMGDDRPPPDYLFHSRQRYFTLTGGKLHALFANLAWLSGSILACFLRPVTGSRETATLRIERLTLLRIGIGGRKSDSVSAVTRPGNRIGEPPAWMNV